MVFLSKNVKLLLFRLGEIIAVEDRKQLFTAHLFGISPDATQHAQQFRAFAVLRRGDILEIIGTVIAPVTVEVVNLHALWSRTYPREGHERVAVHAVEMPHDRVLGAADAVGRAPTLAADGRERRLHLVHDASLIGDSHAMNRIESSRPTAIQRFVGGASSDDRAVRQS